MTGAVPRPSVLAALICAGGIACTTVRQVRPAEYIPQHGPDIIWVTGEDSTIVPIVAPHVDDDTLRGTLRGTDDTVHLALTNIRTVTAKVPDHRKTAFLVVGLGTVGGLMLYEFSISKQGSQGGGVNCGVYQSTREGGDPGDARPDC
ncbi:MAG TPA: hypothetical protein VLV16_10835 [Gemmatimonadales bacterium]|nr:hypothetical protein [Gemmatimonadales bacterium]